MRTGWRRSGLACPTINTSQASSERAAAGWKNSGWVPNRNGAAVAPRSLVERHRRRVVCEKEVEERCEMAGGRLEDRRV